MRTWHRVQRLLRHEAARTLSHAAAGHIPPPVVVVGADRPEALISLSGVDPDRPKRTLAELILLAAAFRPSRVLAAMAVATSRRRGVLAVHDLTDVADGLVEVTRAWAWRRVGRRVLWLPAELRQWEVVEGPHADLARAVIEERPAGPEPDVLATLLARSAAAGHHVHLARNRE